MRVGGQGIRLLRHFADLLEYEPISTGNRLRIGFSTCWFRSPKRSSHLGGMLQSTTAGSSEDHDLSLLSTEHESRVLPKDPAAFRSRFVRLGTTTIYMLEP